MDRNISGSEQIQKQIILVSESLNPLFKKHDHRCKSPIKSGIFYEEIRHRE